MKKALGQIGRTAILWLTMVVATIVSGILFHPHLPHAVPDGPVTALIAVLLVGAVDASTVAMLAARLTVGGARKAGILFVVVFLLETGLSSIESAAFRDTLGLTSSALFAIAAGGLVRAVVASIAASLLWPRAAKPMPPVPFAAWSFAVLVALYITFYFAAGFFIAWGSEAVRRYYHGGAGIDLTALLGLQVVRGAIWTGLALLLARRMSGRTSVVMLCTAFLFAVLMAAPLIYPSAIMPWAVRRVHLVELAVANAAFGALAIALLRRGATT